jgi:succinate dehydrogenase / fumarate reductase, cytochrome b subunit
LLDTQNRPDVYTMMVLSFTNPILTITYIVAVGLLCLHLSHGFFSFFQTLGLNKPEFDSKLKLSSVVFGLSIFLGFASVPVAIFVKIIS